MMGAKPGHGLPAVAAALLLSGNGALQDPKFLLSGPIPHRILGLYSIAVGNEAFDADIEAGDLPGCRQVLCRGLTGKAGVPAIGLPDYPESRRFGRDLPMPPDCNPADAGELQPAAGNPEAVAVFLEAETVEPVSCLEPWVSRLLAGFEPTEEVSECLVQIGYGNLEDMAMDVLCVRIGCLDLFHTPELLDLGDRPASRLIDISAFGQAVVIQSAAGLDSLLQKPLLRLRGIQPVCKGLNRHYAPFWASMYWAIVSWETLPAVEAKYDRVHMEGSFSSSG